jgi:hypothetical protein
MNFKLADKQNVIKTINVLKEEYAEKVNNVAPGTLKGILERQSETLQNICIFYGSVLEWEKHKFEKDVSEGIANLSGEELRELNDIWMSASEFLSEITFKIFELDNPDDDFTLDFGKD